MDLERDLAFGYSVGLKPLERPQVKSEIGPQTQGARRDQRKKQATPQVGDGFNKQRNLPRRFVLGHHKKIDFHPCVPESSKFIERPYLGEVTYPV